MGIFCVTKKTALKMLFALILLLVIESCYRNKQHIETIEQISSDDNIEIQNEKISYLSLNGTVWTAEEDNLLSSNGKYDVELIFNGNRYKLTIKDSIGKVIRWQHENGYKIDGENLIFSLKLGEIFNANVADDIIIIKNWTFGNRSTYELKKDFNNYMQNQLGY